MTRCRLCVLPDTRPDTAFVDGVCSACLTYAGREQIDWESRRRDLLALLDRHDGRCIVPSSGGKDSHYQALTLIELGADVTVVTATTCMLTDVGRRNIDNLARYARAVEVTPNRAVRAKLNRIGLEMVGDVSWPEHVSIFTTPFRVARALSIPLIFYGENPQAQYGGPLGAEEAKRMTRRWVSEFGGFLGLRPSDVVGVAGIAERDMRDYLPLADVDGIEAHFLGQYIPWDSHRNASVALRAGMVQRLPCEANLWEFENLDNAMTGLHDYGMFLKYGYGRGAAQAAVDVRAGRIARDEALSWVEVHDGLFPDAYMGVPVEAVLERIGMTRAELDACMERFTNREAVAWRSRCA
jgi:N-acetyl sugar amidotransferase